MKNEENLMHVKKSRLDTGERSIQFKHILRTTGTDISVTEHLCKMKMVYQITLFFF